jgi:16S rRNA (uracil1498-N3)-methyltransferase
MGGFSMIQLFRSFLTKAFYFYKMTLPFFYTENYDASAEKELALDEDTSRHIISVLRMKVGEQLNLTDGKGNLVTCAIIEDHKKHCKVKIKSTSNQRPVTRHITIAISLLKNSTRFEWFLEKVTEIGINEIIPLICERTGETKVQGG